MRRFALVLAPALLLAGAPASSRAALDLSSRVICAIVDVYDCSGQECVEVESESVGVPDLLRLDPTTKELIALDPELNGASQAIDSLRNDAGTLSARAVEGDRTMILAITDATGDALLTVSDVKLTLVGYGACAKD